MKFMDLSKGYEKRKDAIDARIHSIIERAQFIYGAEHDELETSLAVYAGRTHAIATCDGTAAITLALLALGIKADEDNSKKDVIVPAFTFFATAEAPAFLGMNVVFCDIEEDSYNIDATKLEALIGKNTFAIIPVNLFGQCADYDAILRIAEKRGVHVIEDAAQSFGAEYKGKKSGSFGVISCTSFFPAKPLGCFGDGGMTFTDDDELAKRMKFLRQHGDTGLMTHIELAFTGRLDNLQAGILLEKCNGFDEDMRLRRAVAEYYTAALKDTLITPVVKEGNVSVWAQYCVRHPKRDEIIEALKAKGIPTAIYYRKPLHTAPVFKQLGYKETDMPVSLKVSKEIFALPIYPELPREDQDTVIAAIKEAVG